MKLLYERGEWERDLARNWWRLPPHTLLSLADGQRCLLLYNGQPGGSAGPDVRDAVLCFLPSAESESAAAPSGLSDEGVRVVGDVEFHTYESDWFAHHHQSDPRYNRVILHVVLVLDGRQPARRQDGTSVPTCSLHDLPKIPEAEGSSWPCQRTPLAGDQLTATLLAAGLLRFGAKSQALRHALHEARERPGAPFDLYDTCLLPALAEGLAYGRDRAFFRAVGLRLVGLSTTLPEPLGRASYPAPLDARRLRILYTLGARWRRVGAWRTFRQVSEIAQSTQTSIASLRAVLRPLGRARADILICNVILPFAVAVAEHEHTPHLAAWATRVYLAYPGLASNRVTRMMSAQLQLSMEPEQASLQQGLQHIYAHTCQAKRCQMCLCGGERL